jgi:uncharacterized membrane protein YhaH (DUF805 family)
MSKSVFLNYRREDSSGTAGRLFDALSQRLSGVRVFMDVEGMEPGVDFVSVLEEKLVGCDYFLAVVGPHWANSRAENGSRRLDDPNDLVRLEIETALRRGIRVVPVLVDGASMPQVAELPASLRGFATRNAVIVTHPNFASNVTDLAAAIAKNLGMSAAPAAFVAAAPNNLSWADALMSFRGRMSRAQYWFWNLLVLLPLTLLLQELLLRALGSSLINFATQLATMGPQQHLAQQNLVAHVGVLPIYWCAFAIGAKRMHDFNAGWGLMAAYVVLTLLMVAGAILTFVEFSNPFPKSSSEAAILGGLLGLTSGFGILYAIVDIGIGCIAGTPGPNRFGPEPRSHRTVKAASSIPGNL